MSGKSSHNILKPYIAQLQAELHFLKVEKIGEITFYRLRGNVNSVTLLNKFMVSYGDIQMAMCILRITWSTLRIWRGFS